MLQNYTIQHHVKLPLSGMATSQNIPPNLNREVFRLRTSLTPDNFHTHIVISPSDWNVAMIISSLFSVLKRACVFLSAKKNLHHDVPSATRKRARRLLEAVLPRSQHHIQQELIVINILTVQEEYLAIRGIHLCS